MDVQDGWVHRLTSGLVFNAPDLEEQKSIQWVPPDTSRRKHKLVLPGRA